MHPYLLDQALKKSTYWGRREDARRTLKRAAVIFPDSAEVRRALEGGTR